MLFDDSRGLASEYPCNWFEKSNSEATWTLPSMADDKNYETPDVTELINEIITRPEWIQGNSITLVISQEVGKAAFYSKDGGFSPVLLLEYEK